MSRRGYERAFASETGCTPYEYLLRLREQEARRLLRDTTLPLYRIGEAVGIPDPPRFSAFFKKRVGVAASEWRRSVE
jgi:transcriptional regulator GlxA family with amidase domain